MPDCGGAHDEDHSQMLSGHNPDDLLEESKSQVRAIFHEVFKRLTKPTYAIHFY
jgi:hypothetical protein